MEIKVKFSKDEPSKGSTHSKVVSKVKNTSIPTNDLKAFRNEDLGDNLMTINLSTLLIKRYSTENRLESDCRLFIGVNASVHEVQKSKCICVDIFGGIAISDPTNFAAKIETKFYFKNHLSDHMMKKIKIDAEFMRFDIRARMIGYQMTDTENSEEENFKLFLVLHTPVYKSKIQLFFFTLKINKSVFTTGQPEKISENNTGSFNLILESVSNELPSRSKHDLIPKPITTDVISTPINFKPCPKLPNDQDSWFYNLQVPSYMRTEIIGAHI